MSLAETAARWYALQVRPNYEVAVSVRLRDLGVEEYLPIHKGTQMPVRNRCSAGPALFPGYTFSYVNLQTGPRLYTIPGVIRILGHGGKATPIEEDEIAMVKTIANSPLKVEPIHYMQPGDEIRLVDGPLKGVCGTLIRADKPDQLLVSLPMLQRSLAVSVLSEWVVKAGPNPGRSADAASLPINS